VIDRKGLTRMKLDLVAVHLHGFEMAWLSSKLDCFGSLPCIAQILVHTGSSHLSSCQSVYFEGYRVPSCVSLSVKLTKTLHDHCKAGTSNPVWVCNISSWGAHVCRACRNIEQSALGSMQDTWHHNMLSVWNRNQNVIVTDLADRQPCPAAA